jgi:hypothetical protein
MEYKVRLDLLIDPVEHSVICPKCGHNYSHIREVFTRLGIDPVEGGRPYQGTIARGATLHERRACLVIVFEGECGHIFEWQIQQHKGNDYATAKYIRWNVEDYGPEPEEPSGAQ